MRITVSTINNNDEIVWSILRARNISTVITQISTPLKIGAKQATHPMRMFILFFKKSLCHPSSIILAVTIPLLSPSDYDTTCNMIERQRFHILSLVVLIGNTCFSNAIVL